MLDQRKPNILPRVSYNTVLLVEAIERLCKFVQVGTDVVWHEFVNGFVQHLGIFGDFTQQCSFGRFELSKLDV